MTPLEEARQLFQADAYAVATTGVELEAVGDRYARCSLQLDQRHRNAAGQIMGGVTFTLADFTFAVAANFRQPVTTVSVSCQIMFLGIVRGQRLVAETTLLKEGRRNCFYQVAVRDELGTPIAQVNITGAHLEAPSSGG